MKTNKLQSFLSDKGRAFGLLVLSVSFALGGCSSAKKSAVYEFSTVSRSSLEKTVSSTGTLNPVATVKVLPRMSGKVEKVYVDYNDQVKAGDILAELNTDMLHLQREQQMNSVLKARANYELQLINYQNQVMLAQKNLISEYDLKTTKTNLDMQAADLASSEANLKVIDTQINQYAYITSPIDGIVLERNINVGDTVVESSNSNSTSIFTLAENLREMQIEAGVGELDVASIRKGQEVRFTLESLSGRSFIGLVDSLHLIPTVQSSVVSYTVIINVENDDGSLLPGMTCAVEFIVDRREDILVVSNAALRYQPTGLSADEISTIIFNAGLKGMTEEQQMAAIEERNTAQKAAATQSSSSSSATGIASLVSANPGAMRGGPGGFGPGGNRSASSSSTASTTTRSAMTVKNLWYINSEGKPDVIQVRAGISSGSLTEIQAAENIEGLKVIIREKI
jgi:HlyD family secretion protein